MKLSWIRKEPEVERPVQDIGDLFDMSSRRPRGGIMGPDVETALSVDRILAAREKYKKPTAVG